MLNRLEQINNMGIVRGVVLNVVASGTDIVLQPHYTRKLPMGTQRSVALDKRSVVLRDMLSACIHAATIYGCKLHVQISRRDPIDVVRSLGFRQNLLAELSNGLRINVPAYHQLYSKVSNG